MLVSEEDSIDNAYDLYLRHLIYSVWAGTAVYNVCWLGVLDSFEKVTTGPDFRLSIRGILFHRYMQNMITISWRNQSLHGS